jgi:microcystin degradation protein MlrC
MTLRIAVGGFMHESHSFAPLPTRYADFVQPGGFPPLTAGVALIDAVRTTSIPLAGAIEAGEAQGVTLVPLAWAFANPAGPVEDEAFERIAALICAGLSNALDVGPLYGVYLDLHGAAVAVSFPDAEGELLRRVRAIIGNCPLTISLDPHANLTRHMVDQVDALVPFRTYPHIDMRAAGAQAMRLLIERIGRGTPWARVFRQVDFWIPLPSQCTLMDPMMGVLSERMSLSQQAGVAELAFCFGFPYADFADCGVAIAAYADTEEAAAAAADGLAQFVNAREATFRLDIIEAEAAVAQAIRVAATAKRPVVIADTQDNPGGGGHGDTTGLLAELIRQHAKGAVLALINDAESATSCHAAGEGAKLALSLGGKSDGVPLAVEATVLRLTDGNYINTGPMGRGNPSVLGPTALIEVGGVRVIVVSRKTQAYDQALFRHVGIEPSECSILALKSSVHFRADFAPMAELVLVAAAPGPVVADPATLTFHHVRPGIRMRPMANA